MKDSSEYFTGSEEANATAVQKRRKCMMTPNDLSPDDIAEAHRSKCKASEHAAKCMVRISGNEKKKSIAQNTVKVTASVKGTQRIL